MSNGDSVGGSIIAKPPEHSMAGLTSGVKAECRLHIWGCVKEKVHGLIALGWQVMQPICIIHASGFSRKLKADDASNKSPFGYKTV